MPTKSNCMDHHQLRKKKCKLKKNLINQIFHMTASYQFLLVRFFGTFLGAKSSFLSKGPNWLQNGREKGVQTNRQTFSYLLKRLIY